MVMSEAKCDDCVKCDDKVNGLNIEIQTGKIADAIGNISPIIGNLLYNILDFVDFEFGSRFSTSGLKAGLENTKKCNDGNLTHRATFGFTSCKE